MNTRIRNIVVVFDIYNKGEPLIKIKSAPMDINQRPDGTFWYLGGDNKDYDVTLLDTGEYYRRIDGNFDTGKVERLAQKMRG